LAGVVNWSNAAKIDDSRTSTFTLDAEVIEVRLHVERSVSSTVAVRAELPWKRTDGGTLDSFIEDWHSVLGLPSGSRRRLPRDQFLVEFLSDGTTQLRVDEDTSGLGDIPLAVGYQLQASDERALAAWLTVKVPVGESSDLTGSGAVDLAVSLSYQAQVHENWELFGQLNAVRLGDGDLLPELQEDGAWSALAGATWRPWRMLDLTVQLGANSRVFDGDGTYLSGDAIVLTFGGRYRTQGGWQFDVGISEDIEAGASPDIGFNFAARRGF
jgi:hypothetical protein